MATENYLKHLAVLMIAGGSIVAFIVRPDSLDKILTLWGLILTYVFVKNGYALLVKEKK